MGGMGGRKIKKTTKEQGMMDSGESSEDYERGKGWLEKHSMRKVGLSTHARPTRVTTEERNVAIDMGKALIA